MCSVHVCGDSPQASARDPEPTATLLFCPAPQREETHTEYPPQAPHMVIFAFSLEVKWLEYSRAPPLPAAKKRKELCLGWDLEGST